MQQAASRSGESGMTASNAESWARLRLVQGESSAQRWELLATQAHTTMMVGENPSCTWVVREEGVRPIHFSLHWDGSTLRVADVYGAGDVRVDGTLVTSQWRPLHGRARIEFGKAAMVVETSGAAALGSEPPAAQPFAADAVPKRASARPSRNPKGTLIGVVPGAVVPSYLQAPAAAPPASTTPPAPTTPPHSQPPSVAASSSEPTRPRNERGSLKATLVGGVGMFGAGGAAKPKHNATLVGFRANEVLRGVVSTPSAPPDAQPVTGGSLGEADQRTVQGFPVGEAASSSAPPSPSSSIPGRRRTQQGVISRPPGVLEGAVSHAPVRTVSSGPPVAEPGSSIGSAWQEIPEVTAEPLAPYEQPPQPAIEEPVVPRPPRMPRVGASAWDIGERLSEIPTQMRDQTSFATARRRRRGFPWRYVGVLLLTGVAYFAWLYLLDHW